MTDIAINSTSFINTSGWEGWSNVKNLFVFGDSYSSIGSGQQDPNPTKDLPLGVPFPGVTYAENDSPNWIGHLIDKYTNTEPLVYDYAVGGCVIKGMSTQVQRFLRGPGSAGSTKSWSGSDSLFVTWIGNNDVAYPFGVSERTLQPLFTLQEILYSAGARNFLFLNVPSLPRPRRPEQQPSTMLQLREERCLQWNEAIQAAEHDGEISSVGQFSAQHPEIVALLFDAHAVFAKFFADPTKYGLPIDAGRAFDQAAYVDHIHPTTRVHDLLAKEVAAFLLGRDVDEKQEGRYSGTPSD